MISERPISISVIHNGAEVNILMREGDPTLITTANVYNFPTILKCHYFVTCLLQNIFDVLGPVAENGIFA